MLAPFHSARLGPVVTNIVHERQVVTMLLLPGGGPGRFANGNWRLLLP
jgi:hypothetical protein